MKKITAVIFPIFIIFAVSSQFIFFSRYGDFPYGRIVKIDKGASLSKISQELKSEGIIKTEWPFNFLARISGKQKKIQSGDYYFKEPVSAFGVLARLVSGDSRIDPVRVTIPEGNSSREIPDFFVSFENFDKEEFLKISKNEEGHLFPDTYLFAPSVSASDVVKIMEENFNKKAGAIKYEDLIMASIIEKEVPESEDRRIVSGILWKRIEIGMPLQVDAVFPYILGEKKSVITLRDLKIDSPYNTYLNKGLPPGPITNPGLDAIEAAKNPKKSSYLYYLSDKSGKTHFAATFEDHLINKNKYLR